MTKRWVISWAQNATAVHAPFLAALKRYAKVNDARLVVVAGRYRNPTSLQEGADDNWHDKEVWPYLTEERTQLCPNLCLYGDVRVQPTATRPLSGFEVFCGRNSGIFGHPKRAFETIATASRMPRILATTGACTVENYSDSKAGKKGHAHHVLGALVVEVEADGTYHVRRISAVRDGSFTDLDRVYSAERVTKAPPALGIVMGDLHAGIEDRAVLGATKELAKLIRPQHIFLHDVLDFRTRNHHDKTLRQLYEKRRGLVSDEVADAVMLVNEIATWGAAQVVVVRSNHDEAFERYLQECDPHKDPENAPYYFAVWSRMFEEKFRTGKFPDAFPFEARRIGVAENVRFLARDEDVVLGDVSHGFHGDKGTNGSRGTPYAYAKLGVKTSTGHTHTPCERDGNITAGLTAQLEHGYNLLPSTWLPSQIIQYANGKRTLVTIVRGRFRAPVVAAGKKAA